MPRPTVCAALIVKNESAVIERCLTAARPVIDSYLVIDTGSTDDTVERIPRTWPDTPGEVERRSWRDFGSNRSELVALAAERTAVLKTKCGPMWSRPPRRRLLAPDERDQQPPTGSSATSVKHD